MPPLAIWHEHKHTFIGRSLPHSYTVAKPPYVTQQPGIMEDDITRTQSSSMGMILVFDLLIRFEFCLAACTKVFTPSGAKKRKT